MKEYEHPMDHYDEEEAERGEMKERKRGGGLTSGGADSDTLLRYLSHSFIDMHTRLSPRRCI